MICPECYSEDPRITPLLCPEKCLTNHRQYVCSVCGRCICAEVDRNNKFRAKFPFKTLEIAILYLRAAEAIYESPCEIYEVVYKNERTCYKIFKDRESLIDYLKRNPEQSCDRLEPLYTSENYLPVNHSQLRMLSAKEVQTYLKERSLEKID